MILWQDSNLTLHSQRGVKMTWRPPDSKCSTSPLQPSLGLDLDLGFRGQYFIFQARRPKICMVVDLDHLYLYLASVWTSASASTSTSASEVNISFFKLGGRNFARWRIWGRVIGRGLQKNTSLTGRGLWTIRSFFTLLDYEYFVCVHLL